MSPGCGWCQTTTPLPCYTTTRSSSTTDVRGLQCVNEVFKYYWCLLDMADAKPLYRCHTTQQRGLQVPHHCRTEYYKIVYAAPAYYTKAPNPLLVVYWNIMSVLCFIRVVYNSDYLMVFCFPMWCVAAHVGESSLRWS
jgi:hypothetical protein